MERQATYSVGEIVDQIKQDTPKEENVTLDSAALKILFKQIMRDEGASHRIIKVKKVYVDMVDDLVAGVLLGQIVYWNSPAKKDAQETKLRIQKHGHLWLAKSRHSWWDEIRISPHQVDRALNILRKRGIIETKLMRFNGSPTLHIRLIEETFTLLYIHYTEYPLKNPYPKKSKKKNPDFTESVKSN